MPQVGQNFFKQFEPQKPTSKSDSTFFKQFETQSASLSFSGVVPKPTTQQETKEAQGFIETLTDEVKKTGKNFTNSLSTMASGFYRASGSFFNTLDQWSKFIEEKTGIRRGGLFKDISEGQREIAESFAQKGINPNSVGIEKFAKELYGGLGQAAFDIPAITAMGLPVFSALSGGAEAIEQDESVIGGTAIGLAHGLLLHGILKGSNVFSKNLRIPLNGSVFGGQSLINELQKEPEDRDYEKVASDFFLGAGLSIAGPKEGITAKDIVRGISIKAQKAFGKIEDSTLKRAAKTIQAEIETPKSKLESIKLAIQGKPTSEVNAIAREIVTDRFADIREGQLVASRFKKQIEKRFKESEQEDMIFFREKTGNPFIEGDTFETLSKRLSAEAKEGVRVVGGRLDRLFREINESNYIDDVAFVENYITHLWTGPNIKKVAPNAAKGFVRKFKFAKQRKIETIEKGIKEFGLIPRFNKISEIVQYYENLVGAVKANNRMVDRLRQLQTSDGRGFVYRINELPESLVGDYVEFKHPSFRRLYAKEGKVIEKTKTETERVKSSEKFLGEQIKETVKSEGKIVEGDLAKEGPAKALEGIVIDALKVRGMAQGEAENFVIKLKGGKEAISDNATIIEKVKEITREKEITKERLVKEITEITREKPSAILEERIWVHPEVMGPMNRVFDTGFNFNRFGRSLLALSAIAKKTRLSLSFFHHLALGESGFASTGKNPIQSWKVGLKLLRNPNIRMIDPLTGKKITIDVGRKAVRAGLQVEATGDVQKGVIDRYLSGAVQRSRASQIPGLHQTAKTIKWTNDKWDKLLWEYYHSGLKMDAWFTIYQKNLEKFGKKGFTDERIAREAAQFVNDAFGGQNWDAYFRSSKKLEQVAQLMFLAPDWTLSNIKIAGRGFASLFGMGPQTVRSNAFKYWIRAGLMFTVGQDMVQWMLLNSFLSEEEKQKRAEEGRSLHMWDNDPEHKFNVELPWRDNKGRKQYIKPLKQAREILRYFSNPIEIVGNKLNPVVQEIVAQFTGRFPGSEFEQDWSRQRLDFWESVPLRLKQMVTNQLPLSLKGNSFLFILPKSTGMNNFKSVRLFQRNLRAYAEEKAQILKAGQPISDSEIIETLTEISKRSSENNLDTKRLFTSALTSLKTHYYSELFKELNRDNIKKVNRIAKILSRLNANEGSVERSLLSKYRRMIRENQIDLTAREAERKVGKIKIRPAKSGKIVRRIQNELTKKADRQFKTAIK